MATYQPFVLGGPVRIAAAGTVIGAMGAAGKAILKQSTVLNQDLAAIWFTVGISRGGAVPTGSDFIIEQRPIDALGTDNCPELQNLVLGPSDGIWIYAQFDNVLTATISGFSLGGTK